MQSVELHENVKFIVVEDDDLDFKRVTRAMKKLKVENEVVRAHDGLEALDLLKGRNGRQKARLPYTILLDLNMPRMNGLEFLDFIRQDPELQRDVVFILTSSDSDQDMEEAYKLQVAGYIQKGESEESFAEAISMMRHYWKSVVRPI